MTSLFFLLGDHTSSSKGLHAVFVAKVTLADADLTSQEHKACQNGPEKDHDIDDCGTHINEHLWHAIYIRFNYILHRRQVISNGSLLPLLIQPSNPPTKSLGPHLLRPCPTKAGD